MKILREMRIYYRLLNECLMTINLIWKTGFARVQMGIILYFIYPCFFLKLLPAFKNPYWENAFMEKLYLKFRWWFSANSSTLAYLEKDLYFVICDSSYFLHKLPHAEIFRYKNFEFWKEISISHVFQRKYIFVENCFCICTQKIKNSKLGKHFLLSWCENKQL